MALTKLESLAEDYGLCETQLKAELDWIKKRYKKQEAINNAFLNQGEAEELLESIRVKTIDLATKLSAIKNETIKKHLESMAVKERWDDDNYLTYGAGFIDDLEERLRSLSKAAGSLEVRIYGTKKQSHKKSLVRDLRLSWKRLTGSDQRVGKPYQAFVERACECMGIDSQGVWTHHIKTR